MGGQARYEVTPMATMTEKVMGKIDNAVSLGKEPKTLVINEWEWKTLREENPPLIQSDFTVFKTFMGLDVTIDAEAEMRVE